VSCHFHSSLRFISEADTVPGYPVRPKARPRLGRYVDVGVSTKVSATAGKNIASCRLRNMRREATRGLDEEERKWQSAAGITLRFLPRCVVRRCSFRRALALVLSEGIQKRSLFSRSLSVSFPRFLLAAFVFPPVSTSRLIAVHRVLLPNGENDTAVGHERGISRTVRATSSNSFCGLRRRPRLLLARWL